MFAVISVTGIPDHLHGYLSRFFTEAGAGLYVGVTSTTVTERIWQRVKTACENGSATMIVSDSSREQGFRLYTSGSQSRSSIEIDGLTLIANLGKPVYNKTYPEQ